MIVSLFQSPPWSCIAAANSRSMSLWRAVIEVYDGTVEGSVCVWKDCWGPKFDDKDTRADRQLEQLRKEPEVKGMEGEACVLQYRWAWPARKRWRLLTTTLLQSTGIDLTPSRQESGDP